MTAERGELLGFLDRTFDVFGEVVDRHDPSLAPREIGTVEFVGKGIARVGGLPNARMEELLRFPGDRWGMVFDLAPDEVGVVLLDGDEGLTAGAEVRRTGRILDVPVGDAVMGRVVSPTARPLDGRGPIRTTERRPVERPAPGIMERDPVSVPLQTGIKVIDALIPVGRGQRELILGDRQTGKTAIALDTIINQKGTGVICFYCAIGQRSSAVAKLVDDLKAHDALDYCVVVVASGDDPPGLQYIAPYAATAMAEQFMEMGHNVLIVYDDLTAHARAYREVSLLLRRPPGREAFPGDIFYIHSRLLERSTHLRREPGGGSLTSLPVVETEAENMSAYIPTNIISITDGQIYLSPRLYRRGVLPAVDVGKSVSRVGGKAQLASYRSVAGALRLTYSQFEELEAFSRFGTRLDAETQRTLERGRRVREILRQPRYEPLTVPRQIALLLAVNEGLFDQVPIDKMAAVEGAVGQAVEDEHPAVCRRILCGRALTDEDTAVLLATARRAIEGFVGGGAG